MTRLPRLRRRLGPVLLLAVLAVPGCAGSGSGQSASAAQQAACRKRADEVWARQNRGAVYAADNYATSLRDSPFSSSGVASNTTSGLGSLYSRDTMISDCVKGLQGGAEPLPGPNSSGPSGSAPAKPIGPPPNARTASPAG